MGGVECSRRHILIRFDVEVCPAGHVHRVWVCPMKIGTERCGEVVIIPPFTSACDKDKDKDEDERP